MYLKNLELEGMETECWEAIALTERRIERLKDTQKRNPGWHSFDRYADADVGIDVRIEEQQAVLEGQEGDLIDIQKEIEKRKQASTLKAVPVREQGKQVRMI